MSPEQRWDQAGLADDFIFNKVLSDPFICKEVIQRILPDKQIERIEIPNSQHEVNIATDAKGVRFDIYTSDDQGTRYDLEMQVVNHHNINQRARFYQAAMANEAVEKGANYRSADSTYVIFFCMFDPLNLGRQRYTIHRHIDEEAGQIIHDGTVNIYFNVQSLYHEVDAKMQEFLDIIAQRPVEENNDFVVKLKKRIKFVKQNKKWRADYMRLSFNEMDHQWELQQAEQRERESGIKALINSLKNLGISRDKMEQQLILNYKLTAVQANDYLTKFLN